MAAAGLRGYFIGLGQMGVSALSLAVMEGGKLLFALALARSHAEQGAAAAAQWAKLGVCIGEILSLLLLAGFFFYSRARTSIRQGVQQGPVPPMKETAKALWAQGGVLLPALAPVAQIGSSISWVLILMGLISSYGNLVQWGIIAFAAIVLFQLVTLPVEFNASSRALAALEGGGFLARDEVDQSRKVLSAAALTYVAAAIVGILQLLRLVLIFGNRRD